MLHNFGGNLGLYGRLPFIATEPLRALEMEDSSMLGVGMTMEGINQNFIVYELMAEMGWRADAPDVGLWVRDFIRRRYGLVQTEGHIYKVWDSLRQDVYSCNTTISMGIPKNQLVLRPYLTTSSSPQWTGIPIMPRVPCHKPERVIEAMQNMLQAAHEVPDLRMSKTFQYDLVDICRQTLSDLFIVLRRNVSVAFESNDVHQFEQAARILLESIDDLDRVLGTNEFYLLGRWIESARAKATSIAEADLYEFNARNQVTLWGPEGNIADYASKQWAGLVGTYYMKRWEFFLRALSVSLQPGGLPFNQTEFNEAVFKEVEWPWQVEHSEFPIVPIGDAIELSSMVLHKYFV